jgi:hypothetical protein
MENPLFDYYQVCGMDANLDALRGRTIRKVFPSYEEAKHYYDNIDKDVKKFLQSKQLIFRAANGEDKLLESWYWSQRR